MAPTLMLIAVIAVLVAICYAFFGNKENPYLEKLQSMTKTAEDFKKNLISKGFNISKEINHGITTIIAVDDINKKWSVHWTSSSIPFEEYPIFDYSQLLDFGVRENGNQIIQGRAGSALAGGVLFGAAGAVVGASRKKEINTNSTIELNIIVNDLNTNSINIQLLKDVPQDTSAYQNAISFAQEAVSLFTYIQNNQ